MGARRPRFTLADTILPESTRIAIDSALAKIRFHRLIYDEWGFGRVDPAGRGVTLNLYGPSGTGKTRTAEAIAGELGLEFVLVTPADVESKYMGDSAKAARRIFRECAGGRRMLFFDEADTLFGRRAADVTQGVDHEVNAVKSTLLAEMNEFEGVLVLATNFPANLDPAFRRRVSHHVRFDLPDGGARRRLWELHLVPGIPVSVEREIMLDRLTEISEGLTGGDVLTALRIALPTAAARGTPLQIEDLANSLESVRRARRDVGTRSSRSDVDAVRQMLGIREPSAPREIPTGGPGDPAEPVRSREGE